VRGDTFDDMGCGIGLPAGQRVEKGGLAALG